MLGYGRSSAPRVPPSSLSLYTVKQASDDIKDLALQLGAPQIVLGYVSAPTKSLAKQGIEHQVDTIGVVKSLFVVLNGTPRLLHTSSPVLNYSPCTRAPAQTLIS